MKGLANLLSTQPPDSVKFLSMVGRDASAAEYRRKLAAQQVEPLLLVSAAQRPTACARECMALGALWITVL